MKMEEIKREYEIMKQEECADGPVAVDLTNKMELCSRSFIKSNSLDQSYDRSSFADKCSAAFEMEPKRNYVSSDSRGDARWCLDKLNGSPPARIPAGGVDEQLRGLPDKNNSENKYNINYKMSTNDHSADFINFRSKNLSTVSNPEDKYHRTVETYAAPNLQQSRVYYNRSLSANVPNHSTSSPHLKYDDKTSGSSSDVEIPQRKSKLMEKADGMPQLIKISSLDSAQLSGALTLQGLESTRISNGHPASKYPKYIDTERHLLKRDDRISDDTSVDTNQYCNGSHIDPVKLGLTSEGIPTRHHSPPTQRMTFPEQPGEQQAQCLEQQDLSEQLIGNNNNNNNNNSYDNNNMSPGKRCLINGPPQSPTSTLDDATNAAGQPISPTNKGSYKCQVCFDVASGFHYGVWTCEGCKAFFKRSLHGPIRYLCPANNNCTIDKLRRKCCQACRLRRCHECGMGATHARRDSNGRAVRKRERSSMDETNTSPRKKEKLSPVEKTSDKSNLVSTTNTSVGRKILDHLLRIEPVSKPDVRQNSVENGRRFLITSLIEVTYEHLMNVIDWSKAIPEFDKLGVITRSNILVNCWAEMVLIGTIWKSLSHSDGIALNSDLILTSQQDSSWMLSKSPEKAKLGLLWSCEKAGIVWLYDRLTPVIQTFRRLQVTHAEMVLLRLTIFLNAEIDASDKYDCLSEMKTNLNEAWMVLSGNSISAINRMTRMLPLLVHIRHCSLTFLGLLQEIRRNKVSTVPELLGEMLDGDYETLLTVSNTLYLESRALKDGHHQRSPYTT